MPSGTIQLSFKNKKRYSYSIKVDTPTEPEIALVVSKQILEQQVKKGMKRQVGGLPCYNLMIDLLRKQNTRYNMPEPIASNKEQTFLKAQMANNVSPFIESKCTECDGRGFLGNFYTGEHDKDKCSKCNGHGVVYHRTVYRVGKNTDRQLIVESDSTNIDNARLIKNHLEKLFGYSFSVIKTTHGFHFIGSKQCESRQEWIHANCKVLHPLIGGLRAHIQFAEDVIEFDKNFRRIHGESTNKELFESDFKKSNLYLGTGNFDVLYTVLSIKYKKSTLRISQKSPSDTYELITFV